MNVNEFLVKKEEYEKILTEKGKEVLRDLFTPVFQIEQIKKINFKAYTDYWCDGEPCEWCLYDPCPITEKILEEFENGEIEEHELWEEGISITREILWNKQENPYYIEGSAKIWNEFEKNFFKCRDIIKNIFGDHVRVSVSNVNNEITFEVEEYTDHN